SKETVTSYVTKSLYEKGPYLDRIMHDLQINGLESQLLKDFWHKNQVQRYFKYLFRAIEIVLSNDSHQFLMAIDDITRLNKDLNLDMMREYPIYQVYSVTGICNIDGVVLME